MWTQIIRKLQKENLESESSVLAMTRRLLADYGLITVSDRYEAEEYFYTNFGCSVVDSYQEFIGSVDTFIPFTGKITYDVYVYRYTMINSDISVYSVEIVSWND